MMNAITDKCLPWEAQTLSLLPLFTEARRRGVVWTSGSHITQGTTKVNGTYFNIGKYNTPAWRILVMCQEVGHTLGLSHLDHLLSSILPLLLWCALRALFHLGVYP